MFADAHAYQETACYEERYYSYTLEGNIHTDITITVYSLDGRIVHATRLPNTEKRIIWDGKSYENGSVPNGVYIIQITANNRVLINSKVLAL